jgi:glutamate N-acetyltransferase/amino-acid N-acetyltransferase
MTTDLYPKIRRFDFPGGSIVGIAKGAGMVEPNLATMLVYILSDVHIEREALRAGLSAAMVESFNNISIDSDQSTSDTVLCVSSNLVEGISRQDFQVGLEQVCVQLAEDVVRNGEGVRHVQRVTVSGAPDAPCARAIGKSVINSPLWKTALAGNDPNVGRLVMAVGKEMGNNFPQLQTNNVTIAIDGITVCENRQFHLDPERETQLSKLFVANQLYDTAPAADGITFTPPVTYPPHPRCIEISIDLGQGSAQACVIGNDLTHEYVTENADYRS